MIGTVAILNVGCGDTKVSFDPSSPEDRKRAAKVVTDMLKRGYAILVEIGRSEKNGEPIYQRAKRFDPETCEYVVVGVPDQKKTTSGGRDVKAKPKAARGKAKKGKETRIRAERTSAVAVARSAGG